MAEDILAALLIASKQGQLQSVKRLLQQGAEANSAVDEVGSPSPAPMSRLAGVMLHGGWICHMPTPEPECRLGLHHMCFTAGSAAAMIYR